MSHTIYHNSEGCTARITKFLIRPRYSQFLHLFCSRAVICPRQYHTHTKCEGKLRGYIDFRNENNWLPAYSNVCIKHYMNIAIKKANSPVSVGSGCVPGVPTLHTALRERSLQYCIVWRMCQAVQQQTLITVIIIYNISAFINRNTGWPSVSAINSIIGWEE